MSVPMAVLQQLAAKQQREAQEPIELIQQCPARARRNGDHVEYSYRFVLRQDGGGVVYGPPLFSIGAVVLSLMAYLETHGLQLNWDEHLSSADQRAVADEVRRMS